MKKLLIGLVSILVLLLIIVGVVLNNEETTSTVTGIDAAKENLAAITNETNPVATVVLTQDDVDYTFTFELFPDVAPQSVYNFIYLANSGFYDGLTMHRLVSDFVIQGGDPDGVGSGGPGYTIKGEFPENGVETGLTHQVGALAWARSSDYDSAGSQFYIVLNDGNDFLDSEYAVFGYMIDGYENLEHFNTEEVTTDSVPVTPIYIKSVTVDTKGETYPDPTKLNEE